MSIPTPYLSQQPIDDFGLNFSKLLYSAILSASTDTTLTVPATASRFKALIKVKEGIDVWVSLNTNASFPVGATFAQTSSELVGEKLCREVKAGDVLHFITLGAATDISVAFYALGTNN